MTRVLVVDDNVDICEIVRVLLESEGYAVTLRHTGREALAECAASPPDVLLLDVALPDVDGLRVTRSLREQPGLQDLPVLLLTARAHPEDVAAGLAAGADGYLVKPFSSATLLEQVASLLSS